jgi:hypothetical protein
VTQTRITQTLHNGMANMVVPTTGSMMAGLVVIVRP